MEQREARDTRPSPSGAEDHWEQNSDGKYYYLFIHWTFGAH